MSKEDLPDWATPRDRELDGIAREVEAIFPELVTTTADGVKQLRAAGLITTLVRALQELKHEHDRLARRVAELESGTKDEGQSSAKGEE